MLLCEEYLERHSITIPMVRHTRCAVLFSKQSDDERIKKLEAAVQALQAELATLKTDRAAEKAKTMERAAPIVDQKQLEQLISRTFDEKNNVMKYF